MNNSYHGKYLQDAATSETAIQDTAEAPVAVKPAGTSRCYT